MKQTLDEHDLRHYFRWLEKREEKERLKMGESSSAPPSAALAAKRPRTAAGEDSTGVSSGTAAASKARGKAKAKVTAGGPKWQPKRTPRRA
eukprot:12902468-Prorocentrum_lima.AAC.1